MSDGRRREKKKQQQHERCARARAWGVIRCSRCNLVGMQCVSRLVCVGTNSPSLLFPQRRTSIALVRHLCAAFFVWSSFLVLAKKRSQGHETLQKKKMGTTASNLSGLTLTPGEGLLDRQTPNLKVASSHSPVSLRQKLTVSEG